MKKTKINCEEANNIMLYELLLKLNAVCKKTNDSEAWFLSPFRKETKASFKVSKTKNVWYDHGEGFGGNTIDLITRLKNCSVKDALRFLDEGSFSFQQSEISTVEKKPGFEVLKKQNLQNKALVNYLESRGISYVLARTYCFELYYRSNGKIYFAIAFQNNSGGFELRNKYFKGCIGSKDYTLINNSTSQVKIFEGYIDFLSYIEMYPREISCSDYVICNSTAIVDKTIPIIKQYSNIELYLDNDQSGEKAKNQIMNNCIQAKAKNNLYTGFKDLNEMLVKKVYRR